MSFSLEDGYEDVSYSDQKEAKKKLKTMLSMLNNLTGLQADSRVNLHLIPSYWNARLLVDWYPFSTKGWRLTAGVYYGSGTIGEGYNYDEDTALLLAINGYNHICQNVMDEEPVIQVGEQWVEFTPQVNEKILGIGQASFYIGPKTDGSYYHTFPTDDGRVRTTCYVNRWKPYVGIGHNRTIGRTGRCTLAFDCGAAFWGGSPRVITHDGVDLVHDMAYIKKGNLRRLVNGVAALKVLPVVEVRIGWKL